MILSGKYTTFSMFNKNIFHVSPNILIFHVQSCDNLHFSGVLWRQAEIGHIAVSCVLSVRKVSAFGVHDVWSSRTDAQILPCVGTGNTSVSVQCNISTFMPTNKVLAFCPIPSARLQPLSLINVSGRKKLCLELESYFELNSFAVNIHLISFIFGRMN